MIHKKFCLLMFSFAAFSFFTFQPNYIKANELNFSAEVKKNSGTSISEIKNLTDSVLKFNKKDSPKSQGFSEKLSVAKERKILMSRLAEENPAAFLSLAISAKDHKTLPLKIRKEIERKLTITTKIEIIHIDDFENHKNSRFEYFINYRGKRVNFYPNREINIISGTKIKVKGYKIENSFVSDINSQNFKVLDTPPLDSLGDQKTLVILIKFLDSEPDPFSKETAHNLVFNNQFQAFMKEQSYNRVSFSGDVTDWITLNKKKTDDPFGQGVYLNKTKEIKNYIINNNINLNNYGRIIFLINGGYGGGYSSVGKSEVEFNGIKYNLSLSWVYTIYFDSPIGDKHPFEWKSIDHILSHEIGHALGVMHANGLDCGEKINSGDCRHLEYGNLFDVMGMGYYSTHFNAFYKEKLSWIKPEETIIINKSGTYTLYPLETDNNAKLAKIEIETKNKTLVPFYLEHRIGTGFDSNLNDSDLISNQNGLFINKINYFNFFPDTQIIDMNPTKSEWRDDLKEVTLNFPNSFNNTETGIYIKNIKNTKNESISFDAEISDPICERSSPTIITSTDYLYQALGTTGYININFKNSDSFACEPSEFTIIPTLPQNWTYEILPKERIKVNPEEIKSITVMFNIPENTPLSTYVLDLDLININTDLTTKKPIIVYVLEKPIISNIMPEIGKTGTKILINGTGFSKDNFSYHNNLIQLINQKEKVIHTEFIASEDEKTLKFTIPNTIHKYDCIKECVVPTPDGNYELTVFTASAVSNTKIFTVGDSEENKITLSAPNGGEKWQLGDQHTILWSPYSPDKNINPANLVDAYLEKFENGNYTTVGKIIEAGKASIHWEGEIDRYGNYPDPGDYYIRILNRETDEWDRSDNPFTLVAKNTLSADLKINGSDGPITLESDAAYTASWSSNTENCSIHNYTLPYTDPEYQITNLPPEGEREIKFPKELPEASSVYLHCASKSDIEGSARDNVQINPSDDSEGEPFLTVLSPNGGEELELNNQYIIKWKFSKNIEKVSIALYKNNSFSNWIVTDLSQDFSKNNGQEQYSWTPAKTTSEANTGKDIFKIYILGYKKGGGNIEDKSDLPFSITKKEIPQPKLTIIYPNGGETIQRNNTVFVNWKVENYDLSSKQNFKISLIDALTMKNLGSVSSPYYMETYLWNISDDIPNGSYFIKIEICDSKTSICGGSSNLSDTTDNPFNITSTQKSIKPSKIKNKQQMANMLDVFKDKLNTLLEQLK